MVNKLTHLAIIVDGNRRYARNRGEADSQGHYAGALKLEKFLRWTKSEGIREVTAYVLSTENLKNRSFIELRSLYKLICKFLEDYIGDAIKEGVKVRIIGDMSLVPDKLRKAAEKIQEITKDGEKYTLNLCLAYGGRLEITAMVNKFLRQQYWYGGKKEVTEEQIGNSLWLTSEPELIIRTGAASRTSNFLLWQTAYSEWIFLDKMFPDITQKDLKECIKKFEALERRFGK